MQALVEDEDLRLWFDSLADVSPRERAAELWAVAGRIRSKSDHPELAHATQLIAAPGMYEAVRRAVEELA